MSSMLFSAQSANGSSTPMAVQEFKGGGPRTFTAHVWGNFGSGTVKLQASADPVTASADISSGSWIDIPSASWSAAAIYNLDLKTKWLRASLSGAASANLYVYIAS